MTTDKMTLTTPSPISDQAAELAALGELIRTQNNRITDQPLFAVQKRNRVYGIDTDYDPKIYWVNSDHDEVDADKAAELEAAYQEDGDDRPGDYKRLGYHEYWEFVTACFTEQGCKDYLARNGHNLGETRIYAYGTYRNAEWQFVRKFLMNQHALSAAPTTVSSDQAAGEPDLLKEIAQRLSIMLMSASCYTDPSDDDVVTGYRVKTGAMHRIIGLLECAGYTVSVPSNMPVESVDLTPVAWINPSLIDRFKITPWLHVLIAASSDLDEGVTMPLYAAPASPAASVLTDEQIHEIASSYMEADADMYVSFLPSNLDKFARALLAASMGGEKS